MGEGNKVSNNTSSHSEIVDLKKIRQQIKANTIKGTPTEVLSDNVPANAVNQEFHKLANPELRLYIYPHLAGQDQIPVPGYYTILNVYTHDHYALPAE
jgi:conjugative transfer region lipoprotein (TIGR03751 family)